MPQKLSSTLPIKLVGPVMFLMYMSALIDVEVSPDTASYTRDMNDYDYVIVITFSDEVRTREIFPAIRLSSDKVIHVKYPYSINVLLALKDLTEFLHSLFSSEGDVNTYGWY